LAVAEQWILGVSRRHSVVVEGSGTMSERRSTYGKQEMSEEEAQDLFDFAVAMCQYVITLEQKYLEFMARKKEKQRRREERDKEVPF
jgi:hypothetical protein